MLTALTRVPPLVWSRLPTRNVYVPAPATQCCAVRIQVGAMIVAEQFSRPLTKSRAAQGALDAVPPPMMNGVTPSPGAGWAEAGAREANATSAVAAPISADRVRLNRMLMSPNERREW